MPNNARTDYFSGMLVLQNDLAHDQSGRQQADQTRVSDFYTNGVLKDPNGLSNFALTVDGTTNTLVNVGWGTAYANGHRIKIDSNIDYRVSNLTQTINGICTPYSSGNLGVPLSSYTAGQSNFFWAAYLETSNTTPTDISLVDASVHHPHKSDGYAIVVNTTNPPVLPTGFDNAVLLGTVFAQGSGQALLSSPNGICQTNEQFVSLSSKDSLVTANYQDQSVTPQKMSPIGNYTLQSACFTTLIASSNSTVPIIPLQPTSTASRRFAQYAGMGIADSQSVFRPVYDNDFFLAYIAIEGDIVGTITPVYDGLCNIIRINEVVDTYSVAHVFTYATQDGTSIVSAIQEQGL